MHLYCYLIFNEIYNKYRHVVKYFKMENYFYNILVNNNFWYYLMLERQFSWGGNLLKGTGGEYKIYSMCIQEKKNDQNKFD